ncbi:Cytochrome P450 3A13 [Eumeta japonica]|uniref:unspecific monooxygenase n=1 Tax=Eumeta variegata TaxID=151549 RepID=A0A4C1ZUF2_EUMVA|nr:Cytochrome P450 3A13 [Eumeta japonica]
MFFALFELAKHPDILDKLREEVDDVFERCDDNTTKLRCTKIGGVLPVGQIHVDKGTLIHIPVYALHRDPKYYPEPKNLTGSI